ncbi:glycosyltransferase [Enterovibrio norvegicus FF-454]|uniref:Glycosyltransferase n=1 Tax=Enterovibrio norvegicus FF-454 TaxID=1185651 RepID=A0A1E5C6I2_9GAMM|nr:glycosyltransferase [Enterovibrio norvegicus]OEE61103.1 glycosyltransferase [Enterovibrio norvegicus FF-454]
MKSIEITIPVLNEEDTLELQVKKVLDYFSALPQHEYDLCLVIADNGSTDETRTIASKLVESNVDRVRLVEIEQRGVGLALQASWNTSQADIVGYMDLDLATDIEHVKDVMDLYSNNDVDIVYGSRLHNESVVVGRTIKREITSRAFNFLLKTYLSSNFSDGMCGFKFFKRQHIDSLMTNGASSGGWFFCTETLVVAEKLNLNVIELPVKWTDDENSKVKILSLSLEYLKAMRRLKSCLKKSV